MVDLQLVPWDNVFAKIAKDRPLHLIGLVESSELIKSPADVILVHVVDAEFPHPAVVNRIVDFDACCRHTVKALLEQIHRLDRAEAQQFRSQVGRLIPDVFKNDFFVWAIERQLVRHQNVHDDAEAPRINLLVVATEDVLRCHIMSTAARVTELLRCTI